MPEDDALSADVEWKEIKQRIRDAVWQLQELDGPLLEIAVHERTITHRLAIYLEPHFSSWDVDVEYNRSGPGDSKEIPDWEEIDWERYAEGLTVEELTREVKDRTTYPDIIVHHRGTEENLVVIEVKKAGESWDADRLKLRVLGHQVGLNYSHAAFVEIPVADDHLREPNIARISAEREAIP